MQQQSTVCIKCHNRFGQTLESISTARNGATCIDCTYPSKENFKLKQGAKIKHKVSNFVEMGYREEVRPQMDHTTAEVLIAEMRNVSLRKMLPVKTSFLFPFHQIDSAIQG
jgi:hypothetical protein